MYGRDSELSEEDTLEYYRQSLDRSQELFLFNIYNLVKTAAFSIEDTERKHSKYLPSEEDKQFSAKLYNNNVMQSLAKQEELQDLFLEKDLDDLVEEDTLQKYYKSFAKNKEYKTYVLHEDGNDRHRDIILSLYKHLVKDEIFQESMDDHFPTWEDDKSLIIGAMKKTIKALPDSPDLYRTFRPDYEAAVEFGEALLMETIEKDKEIEEVIAPALENWEMDRVANIDRILLKMALCEFTGFPTIPTKVTLNEYVELSKVYSTDKSKDFVNGVLDKLLKDLNEQGAINKSGRGLED